MKLGIDLKVDYAFKWTFGAQSRIDSLRSLLEHTLGGLLSGDIVELTILNPIQDRQVTDGKLSILDILARDQSGALYHVEMQMLGYAELPQRFLYYAAKTYVAQLKEGEDYVALAPLISVIIINDVLFPNLPRYHNCFQFREPNQGTVFCDDIQFVLIELPKFNKLLKDLVDGLDQWLYLFCHSEELDPRNPPLEFTVPAVKQSLENLDIMAHTEQERYLYEARRMAWFDEVKRRNWYMKLEAEGHEKGFREGLQEGMQEGLQVGLQEGLQQGSKAEREMLGRKISLVRRINDKEVALGQQVSAFDQLLEFSEDALLQTLRELE